MNRNLVSLWIIASILLIAFGVDQSFAQIRITRPEELGIKTSPAGIMKSMQDTKERSLKDPVQRILRGRLFPDGRLQPRQVKHLVKQPVAHKPFNFKEFRNPQTGEPLRANDRIRLKNGKVLTGAQYIAQVNNMEKSFNQRGFSLRQRGSFNVQSSMLKSNAELAKQNANSMRKFFPLSAIPQSALMQIYAINYNMYIAPSTALMRAAMANLATTAQQMQNAKYDTINHDGIKTFEKKLPYDDFWGDRDTFGAGVNAFVKIAANKEESKLKSEMNGNAFVSTFGHDWPICVVDARMDAPLEKNTGQEMHGSLNVSILGDSLVNWSDHGLVEVKSSDDRKIVNIDRSVEFRYVIVVVPVKVAAGFTGTAGVRYDLYASPLYAHAKVIPYINTSAYAQCAVDAYIAAAGIEGRLVLLNDTLDFGAIAKIDLMQPVPCFSFEYYGRNNIETLSGAIKAYAEVDLLLWSNKWYWTLYDWTGFKRDDFVIKPERMLVNLYTGEAVTESTSKKLRLTIKQISVQNKQAVNDPDKFEANFQTIPCTLASNGKCNLTPGPDEAVKNSNWVHWNGTSNPYNLNLSVVDEIINLGDRRHVKVHVSLNCKHGDKNWSCGFEDMLYDIDAKKFRHGNSWINAGESVTHGTSNHPISWQYTLEEI